LSEESEISVRHDRVTDNKILKTRGLAPPTVVFRTGKLSLGFHLDSLYQDLAREINKITVLSKIVPVSKLFKQ